MMTESQAPISIEVRHPIVNASLGVVCMPTSPTLHTGSTWNSAAATSCWAVQLMQGLQHPPRAIVHRGAQRA
jgi:hypothetical protein